MGRGYMPIGRRERARQDKRERVMAAARELFAEHGVSGVTTQQIADRAKPLRVDLAEAKSFLTGR